MGESRLPAPPHLSGGLRVAEDTAAQRGDVKARLPALKKPHDNVIFYSHSIVAGGFDVMS
jgi:hypothetical protein